MAKLIDYFEGGGDVSLLKEVEIVAGQLSGERIEITLDDPAENFVVKVEERSQVFTHGGGAEHHSFGEDVIRFDVNSLDAVVTHPNFRDTFSSDTMTVEMRRTTADDASLSGTIKYNLYGTTSSGNWSGNMGSSYGILDKDTGQGYRVATYTNDTTEVVFNAHQYGDIGSRVVGTENWCEYAYEIANAGKYSNWSSYYDKFNDLKYGFTGDTTWFNTLNDTDVVFSVHYHTNTSTAGVELRPIMVEMVNTDGDHGEFGLWGVTVSNTLDWCGNFALVAGKNNGGFRLTGKGVELTPTELGSNVTLNGGGSLTSVQWTNGANVGTGTKSGCIENWNGYAGGVIVVGTPGRYTPFGVAYLNDANGTSTCNVTDWQVYNGYTFSSGDHADVKIWVWYDPDTNAYNDDITEHTTGTNWGTVPQQGYFNGTQVGISAFNYEYNPAKWEMYQHQINVPRMNQQSFTVKTPLVWSYEDMFYHADLSSLIGRKGETNIYNLEHNESLRMYWVPVAASWDGGITYGHSIKDSRTMSTLRKTMFSLGDDGLGTEPYVQRNIIKWSGSEWQINIAGENDDRAQWRFSGAAYALPFIEVWKEETWENTGLTDNTPIGAAQAMSFYQDRVENGEFGQINGFSVWVTNNSGTTQTCDNVLFDGNEIDQFYSHCYYGSSRFINPDRYIAVPPDAFTFYADPTDNQKITVKMFDINDNDSENIARGSGQFPDSGAWGPIKIRIYGKKI